MLVKDSIKYSYNDIAVMPAKISYINHRKETNPYYFDGMLPIFTAPMSSIVNEDNISTYLRNRINVVIPRNIDIKKRIKWMVEFNCFSAMSMQEARKYFLEEPNMILENGNKKMHLCIDVANGHMESLYDLVTDLRARYKNLVIMTGNIANPETIWTAMYVGVDYIRIGIGTGAGCITSSNTSIHYPIASLIDECVRIKKEFIASSNKKSDLKIIADGGIRNYNDVIKALALGADYVMIGGLFGSCFESSDRIYEKDEFGYFESDETNFHGLPLYHKFYGMASKEGMKDLGIEKHTAEGIVKYVEITQTIGSWANNMGDYLRSAMSYTNTKYLHNFSKNAKAILISGNTYQSVNK